MSREPCAVCLDDTAIGRAAYLGRRAATRPDGQRVFLCSDCEARSRPQRRRGLTDEERERMNSHAAIFGIAFNATGH